MVEMRRLGVVLERNSVMAKGQQRSNREKKKPKQDAAAKAAKPSASTFTAPALSVQRGKKKP